MNVSVDQAGNEVAAGPVDFLPALKWPLAHLLDAPVADTHVGVLQRRSALGRDQVTSEITRPEGGSLLADCFDAIWATHAHANSAAEQEIQCVNDQT